MPAVTVIIPNYNHTRFLGTAIRSVLAQTYRDFEIVVVDDGSTDDCRSAVTAVNGPVRYVWQENKGLAAARNTGVRCARGALIALLDADDEWFPDFLERMTALAKRYPQAGAYYCGAQAMDAEGRLLPQVLGTPARAPDRVYQELLRANFIIPSTAVIRHSALVAVGLFDPKLRSCEDWDLWLRLLPAYPLIGLSECLIRYRIHAETLSTRAESMQAAARAVVEKNFGPDDGNEHAWSCEKRRAYGGLYRYHALTSVQRNRDWAVATVHLARALRVDPTLAVDLDLFYDLALGSQPQGYRGTTHGLQLIENAGRIDGVFAALRRPGAGLPAALVRRASGTANFAIGLVAYNAGELARSFRNVLRSLLLRPGLVRDRRAVCTLLKCPLGRSLLRSLRRARGGVRRVTARSASLGNWRIFRVSGRPAH